MTHNPSWRDLERRLVETHGPDKATQILAGTDAATTADLAVWRTRKEEPVRDFHNSPPGRFKRTIEQVRGVPRAVHEIVCAQCEKEQRLVNNEVILLPPAAVAEKFRLIGWHIGHDRKNDLCAECGRLHPKLLEKTMTLTPPQAAPALPPRKIRHFQASGYVYGPKLRGKSHKPYASKDFTTAWTARQSAEAYLKLFDVFGPLKGKHFNVRNDAPGHYSWRLTEEGAAFVRRRMPVSLLIAPPLQGQAPPEPSAPAPPGYSTYRRKTDRKTRALQRHWTSLYAIPKTKGGKLMPSATAGFYKHNSAYKAARRFMAKAQAERPMIGRHFAVWDSHDPALLWRWRPLVEVPVIDPRTRQPIRYDPDQHEKEEAMTTTNGAAAPPPIPAAAPLMASPLVSPEAEAKVVEALAQIVQGDPAPELELPAHAPAPKPATAEARLAILEALETHYSRDDRRYRGAHSDRSIAGMMKAPTPPAWVREVREFLGFGPDINEKAAEQRAADEAFYAETKALEAKSHELAAAYADLRRRFEQRVMSGHF